mgnify:CR=1 FL=1
MDKFRRKMSVAGGVSAPSMTLGTLTVTGATALGAVSTVGGKSVAHGDQSAHIADAATGHALNATFSDTEVEAALNALGTKINAILTALEAFGVTATS